MDWPEILLIDKPTGMTSFDVIRRLRRVYSDATGEKAPKLGHAGTLDPSASGLMVLGVGKGTKQLTELTKLDKVYEAEVLIGRSTTTGDVEGEAIAEKPVEDLTKEVVAKAVSEMTGSLRLPVSAYSAIKKDGVPMYKRAYAAAKKGEVVEDVPVRDMTVYSARLEAFVVDRGDGFAIATITFHVASGTYIRSLAEELGKRIDYPASLCNLRRTKVGECAIKDALTFEQISDNK